MLQSVVRCRSIIYQHTSCTRLHQHSGVDLGLCQGLDWGEVMSWYSTGGVASMARDTGILLVEYMNGILYVALAELISKNLQNFPVWDTTSKDMFFHPQSV